MSQCRFMEGGLCTNSLALPLYGPRPSRGICLVCVHYEGPPRPELPKPNLVQKVVALSRAVSSQLAQGSVGDAQYEERIRICGVCPRLRKSEAEGEVGWCMACGCGASKLAELTVKARMPAARCPINAWPKGDTPSR